MLNEGRCLIQNYEVVGRINVIIFKCNNYMYVYVYHVNINYNMYVFDVYICCMYVVVMSTILVMIMISYRQPVQSYPVLATSVMIT